MTTYTFEGQDWNVPDDMKPEDAMRLILTSKASRGTNSINDTSPSSLTKDDISGRATNPDNLQHDSDWLAASRAIYRFNNPQDFQGSNDELAEYGLDQMGWFNYNLPSMAVDAARIRQAPDEVKTAFVHLMDTYDNLEMSWGGAGRFIKGVALDPTTYVGLSSLGIGTVGRAGVQVMTKAGIRQALKAGVVTAIEGAALTGVQDSISQGVRIDAGAQSEFSYGQLAANAALGAVAGEVLGAASHGIASKLSVKEGAAPGRTTSLDAGLPESHTDGLGKVENTSDIVPSPSSEAQPLPVSDAGEAIVSRTGEPNLHPTDDVPASVAPESVPVRDVLDVASKPEAVGTNASGIEQNPVITAIREALGSEAGSDTASPALKTVLDLKPDEVRPIVEEARAGRYSPEEMQIAKQTFADATEAVGRQLAEVRSNIASKTLDGPSAAVAHEEARQLQRQYDIVRRADLSLSSITGSELKNRVGNLNTGAFRDVSPDSILRDKGFDPDKLGEYHPERITAEAEFQDRLAFEYDRRTTDREIQSLQTKVQDAVDYGDYAEAAKLSASEDALRTSLAERSPDTASPGLDQRANTFFNTVNEWVISTVFTPATVVVNTVPHVVSVTLRPIGEFVVRGMDAKAWKVMATTYSAMAQHSDSAVRAAIAAWRYERDITAGVTDGASKYLEHDPIISRRYGGGFIRFFPRVLSSSDALFRKLNYHAFVAGNAAADAWEEGLHTGLKGAGLTDFVRSAVEKASAQSMASKIDAPSVVAFLRKQGLDRGLKPGPKLDHWVSTELQKNGDLFRQATDQAGSDFADDLAFKRQFSGDSKVSRLAAGYEEFIHANPWMRLAGQLFFRTPVRVFEEGFRLTAGVNLVTPGFLRDLRGYGAGGVGGHAQLRAQGEAMLSFGIAAAVMNLYAQGKITGGGTGDWRSKKTQADAPGWSPYSIRFDDGSELSFRNLDPFATPMKIMVNALDRYSELMTRQSQGERTDKTSVDNALAFVAMSSLSIVQAVKDANLMEGVAQLYELGENLTDPENKQDQLIRFLGQKLQLAVPNVYTKANGVLDPVLTDPVSLDGFLMGRVNPSYGPVPKRYDALGYVMTRENPLTNIWGVPDYVSGEAKAQLYGEKRGQVLNALARLSVATGKNFVAPYDAARFGGSELGLPALDLRTKLTADGKETWHDRLQRYTRDTGVTDRLHQVLVASQGLPVGTPSVDGARTKLAAELLATARTQAMLRLMREEQDIDRLRRQGMNDKVQSMVGARDAKALPGW